MKFKFPDIMRMFLYGSVLIHALSLDGVGEEKPSLATLVEQRQFQAIPSLLKNPINVNQTQVDGMTALHWAAYHDHTDTAKALIQAGANVNVMNRYGITPLYLACLNGNTELVALLLNRGAYANAALYGGETALMTAARTGKVKPVELLLAYGADIHAKDRKNQTAVMWAAAEGQDEVVQTLIEAGADYRTSLDSGFTPFFFAVREGQTKVVERLLAAGINVNEAMRVKKRSGDSPRKDTSPLILAVENGHFELAAKLLEAGANPNDQRSGYSALHILTWVRKPDRGDDGDPAPKGSGNLSSLDFVRQLVLHGADVNIQLNDGRSGKGRIHEKGATPFLMAADRADVTLMKVLLEFGADPFLANTDECTPLLAAAGIGTLAPTEEAGTEEEALEAVKLILELGAKINHVDQNGETVMHGAAYAGFPKMVRLLADHGADIDIWNRPNRYGWTPLTIARGYRVGNFKPLYPTVEAITQVMLEAGVTPPKDANAKSEDIYN